MVWIHSTVWIDLKGVDVIPENGMIENNKALGGLCQELLYKTAKQNIFTQ